MGTLAHFSMEAIVARYGVRHFVETGTGMGDGLAHAAKSRAFDSLWSCEYESTLANAAKERFRHDKRIRVVEGPSSTFLANILDLLPVSESVLFWLDAHFVGADYGMYDYGREGRGDVRLPLETELNLVSECRISGNDIIICDDARIFIDGPFRHGNLPDNVRPHCPKLRGLNFIPLSFETTHDRTILYDHEGYIVLTPKGNPWT